MLLQLKIKKHNLITLWNVRNKKAEVKLRFLFLC